MVAGGFEPDLTGYRWGEALRHVETWEDMPPHIQPMIRTSLAKTNRDGLNVFLNGVERGHRITMGYRIAVPSGWTKELFQNFLFSVLESNGIKNLNQGLSLNVGHLIAFRSDFSRCETGLNLANVRKFLVEHHSYELFRNPGATALKKRVSLPTFLSMVKALANPGASDTYTPWNNIGTVSLSPQQLVLPTVVTPPFTLTCEIDWQSNRVEISGVNKDNEELAQQIVSATTGNDSGKVTWHHRSYGSHFEIEYPKRWFSSFRGSDPRLQALAERIEKALTEAEERQAISIKYV